MERCYYTITPEPDFRFIIWPQGFAPMLGAGEIDFTGQQWAVAQHFREHTMVYVPWEAVQILNGMV